MAATTSSRGSVRSTPEISAPIRPVRRRDRSWTDWSMVTSCPPRTPRPIYRESGQGHRSGGQSRLCGIRNFVEPAGGHVVDIAVDRDSPWNKRMIANARDVLGHAPRVVTDREPVDVLRLGRARTPADIAEPIGSQFGGFKAAG